MNVSIFYGSVLIASWIGAFVIYGARSPRPFFTAIREVDMNRHFGQIWRQEGLRALRHPELLSYAVAVLLFASFFVLATVLLVKQWLAT